jgi:hypothetical protein
MRRMTKIIAIVVLLAAGSVAAQVDPKKTEKGAGELFRGMGQEIQKSGVLGSGKKAEPKKDPAKKDAKQDAKEQAK